MLDTYSVDCSALLPSDLHELLDRIEAYAFGSYHLRGNLIYEFSLDQGEDISKLKIPDACPIRRL